MKTSLALLIASSLVISTEVLATKYWPTQDLTDWQIFLNNGVAYVSSTQFAGHCSYSRGQIGMSGTAFDNALYAYALSAKARGKNLSYVVDDTQTACIIYGLKEVD